MDTTPNQPPRPCRICGAMFALPGYVSAYVAQFATVCPACCEKDAAEQARQSVKRSLIQKARDPEAEWRVICPPDFRDTDPARLPQNSLAKALAWQWGARGLVLHGETGRGKSRTAWIILRREFMAGRTVSVMDSSAGIDYAARYAESSVAVRQWMDRVCTVDILLLDDVLKAKPTDSFEAALFSAITRRTESKRPIILTTNDTGTTLRERLSPDRGPALRRRIREFCTVIHFV